MRYLKKKVARALQRQENAHNFQINMQSSCPGIQTSLELETKNVEKDFQIEQIVLPCSNLASNSDKIPRKKKMQPNKNIVKNYSRAMINFCLSEPAMPDLKRITEEEGVVFKDFTKFLRKNKKKINSIKALRGLLLISETEGKQITRYKRVFKRACEIFLKFFSVNWIFNSKLEDKKRHLKYRFKILRRVRNPLHFTYLENFDKDS